MAEIAFILPSVLAAAWMTLFLKSRLAFRAYSIVIIPVLSVLVTYIFFSVIFTPFELGPFFGVTSIFSLLPALIICMGLGIHKINSPRR